jgi:NitT/TauT family transport system ATP-binding protein
VTQPGPPIPAPGGVIIEVDDLCKHFTTPAGKQVPVLHGINLTVSEGEIVAILGQSGCGKSTLLRCIAGLIGPSQGVVRYRGDALNGANPGVTMVFQTFALLPWLTVRANVELGLEARDVPPARRHDRAQQAIDRIGLKGFESAYPRELSGGMCQRVDFARALVVQPDVLLMDEPFSALDVLTGANLRNDLLDLWASKGFPTKSIVMVTHNIEEAVQMADRIIVLKPKAGKPHDPIANDLPRPRDRRSSQFQALVDFMYGIMTGHPEGEAAGPAMARPGAASPAELPLPHASVGGLDGLLKILSARGGRADLPELATTLRLEIDDLVPLTDAAQLLGFAEVDNADIELTPAGQQWVQAGPATDKQIFAEQARDRAPLVRTIVRALADAPGGKLSKQFFLDLLEHDFTHDQARAQLDTAIGWGRYGELYSYHAHDGQLVLTAAAGSAVSPPAPLAAR